MATDITIPPKGHELWKFINAADVMAVVARPWFLCSSIMDAKGRAMERFKVDAVSAIYVYVYTADKRVVLYHIATGYDENRRLVQTLTLAWTFMVITRQPLGRKRKTRVAIVKALLTRAMESKEAPE